MRRPHAWLAGAVGALAAYRALARRRTTAAPEPAAPSPASDPRAAELRARLAAARAAGDDRDDFEAGETPVDQAVSPPDPEARRREVHEQGRAAIEDMEAEE